MRAVRPIIASMAAAGLALSLVAAEPAPGESAGEASTQMLGADVTATGLGEELTGRLLDIVTEASTVGTSSAFSSVVPLALAGETAGESSASSDGQTSSDSDGGQLGDLGGLLGLSASSYSTSAETTADTAIASVDALTAELAGLFEVLGIQMNTPGITSQVTPDGADATQGLTVTGLDVSLADLGLDADVLGQLGLGQVLDLLSTLDLGDLPGGIDGDLAAIEDLQADLRQTLDGADLAGLEASITDTLAQLNAIDGSAVAAIQSDIDDLEAVLATLEGLSTDPLILVTELGSVSGLPEACETGTLDVTNVLATLDATITCVEDAIADLEADLAAALPDVSMITGLLDSLAGDLGTLQTLLADVTATVEDLLAELGGLQGLLDSILGLLPDLLGDAAGTELLSIGAFDVGMNATAKDTVENSSASVLCAPTTVVVLGQSTTTPDCSEGLSAVSDATATISGALGSVTEVLNTLPLADGLVETGDLKVELFGDVVEKVEEVDGVVTATAGMDILDLQLPSVTLDPSAVTGPLGDLGDLPAGLGDLTALVQSLVDGELATQLDGLSVLGDLPGLSGSELTSITDALAGVTDALDTIDSTGALSGLVDQVTALLDGLDVGDLGSLTDEISTPGLSLVIDPVSNASFEASAAPAPADPEADPAPAPSDDPALPSTGGGLALVAMMALGGATMLARRRQD